MIRLIALLTILSTSAWVDVTGPVRVIDGDTIHIAGERIRLTETPFTSPVNASVCTASTLPRRTNRDG